MIVGYRSSTCSPPIRALRFALALTVVCVVVSSGACRLVNAAQPYASNRSLAPTSLQLLINNAKAGDTIEIPPGTYRVSIEISQSGTPDRPIVVEGSGGNVVITGAELLTSGQWEPLSAKPIWRYSPWDYLAPTIRPGNSAPLYSGEQVVADGTLLARAQSLGSMVPGTFFADPASAHALFVWLPDGSSPTKHTMEGSVRPRLLKVTGNHVIVRNIIFRYASNVAQHPAVDLRGEHNLIDNCVVEYTAGVGLHLGGRHNIARWITSDSNGQLGMGGTGEDNLLEYCTLTRNNTLGYPTDWEAGGIKVVDTERFRISNCIARGNDGTGFWFDIDNRNGIIEQSYAADNTEGGIGVEISREMTVRNNLAVRNGLHAHGGWGQAGILIAESMNTSVEDNVAVDNLTGIAVRQQGVRVLPANSELGRSEAVHFYSYGLVFRHNIAAFNRQWQFALFGDNPFFVGKYLWMIRRLLGKRDSSGAADMQLLDPSKWNWRMDHNVYFAPEGGGLILWGAPWLPRHEVYDSLSSFRKEHDLDQGSIVADPQFIDWKHGDFSLRAGSPAAVLAQPNASRIRH